jgi:hypothetical protein
MHTNTSPERILETAPGGGVIFEEAAADGAFGGPRRPR